MNELTTAASGFGEGALFGVLLIAGVVLFGKILGNLLG